MALIISPPGPLQRLARRTRRRRPPRVTDRQGIATAGASRPAEARAEPTGGFEPPTVRLRGGRSTPELRRRGATWYPAWPRGGPPGTPAWDTEPSWRRERPARSGRTRPTRTRRAAARPRPPRPWQPWPPAAAHPP